VVVECMPAVKNVTGVIHSVARATTSRFELSIDFMVLAAFATKFDREATMQACVEF
jgi:hypothetical protein